MTLESWKANNELKAKRELERRKLEDNFNEEILRRHKAGVSKEEIVADLGISRELFNRVMRSAFKIGRTAGKDVSTYQAPRVEGLCVEELCQED